MKEIINPVISKSRVALIARKLRNFSISFGGSSKDYLLRAFCVTMINVAIFNSFMVIIQVRNFQCDSQVFNPAQYAEIEK